MPADPRLIAAVDGHAAGRVRIEARVRALVVAEFARFDGWYSSRLVDQVTADVAAHVAAGQVGTAQITDAYLARVTTYVTAKSTVGATVPSVMGRTLRRGVADHEAVYARVAAEYRWQRSKGLDDRAALSTAMTRAQEMVSTDMGLAFQRQTAEFTKRRQITRYRRIVRPELSMNGSCGLCVAASDRLYYRGDLMPIHARCKCTVITVTANTDPGSQLNEDTLSEMYGAAGSTAGPDLKRTRYTVVEHGELGPQLRLARYNFRDPRAVAAA